jgi:hypothetical protein
MNHIRITYEYHMCYCCKSAANAMQRERIERKGDIPICDISGYRETGISRDRDIERSGDWEIGRTRDWENESRNPPVDGKQIIG